MQKTEYLYWVSWINMRWPNTKTNEEAIKSLYKDFEILSSRPNKYELKSAKHHLYGFKSSRATFSTGKWLKLAQKKILQTL